MRRSRRPDNESKPRGVATTTVGRHPLLSRRYGSAGRGGSRHASRRGAVPTGRRRSRRRAPRREPGAGRPGTAGDLRRNGQEQLVDQAGADQSAEQVRPALADDDLEAAFAEHLDDGGRLDLVRPIRPRRRRPSPADPRPAGGSAPVGVVMITTGTPGRGDRDGRVERATGADDHGRGLRGGQPELASPRGVGLGRRRVDVGRRPAMVRAERTVPAPIRTASAVARRRPIRNGPASTHR